MERLTRHLKALDELDMPIGWPDVEDRRSDIQRPPPAPRRFLAAVVALAVFAAAAALVWAAWRPFDDAGPGPGDEAASAASVGDAVLRLEARALGPHGVLTFGDQVQQGQLDDGCWEQASGMAVCTVDRLFGADIPADYTAVPASNHIVIQGDASAVDLALRYTTDSRADGTPIPVVDGRAELPAQPGRYVLIVEAEWPQGVGRFYFGIEVVELSPEDEGPAIYESALGWTAELPAGWNALAFEGFNGRFSVAGTSFSNVPLEPTRDGTHPDLSELFPEGAALTVSQRTGGPAPDYLADDSRFPLRWEDFRAIPGGLVVGSVQSFRGNGSEFTVELAVRADAPEMVLEDLRTILASIRPTSLTTGETLANGYVVVEAAAVEQVWSGLVVEAAGASFMLIHAPGGYYALGLPDDVPASSTFSFDAREHQVLWTQGGEVFARYDREGAVAQGPSAMRLAPLPIHPVVRAWDGTHLLLHPGTQYGPLPASMWAETQG